MSESTQHKLSRVRPPRVHITYDVEIGDAIQTKELPFVIGILADLSGHPVEALPRVKDRKFIEIDRDNFNEIMSSLSPRLAFEVPLAQGNDDLNVELIFKSLDDFNPRAVVQQVSPLKEIYQSRTHLHDLLAKLEGNDTLSHLLKAIMKRADLRDALKKQIDQRLSTSSTPPKTPSTPSKKSEETRK